MATPKPQSKKTDDSRGRSKAKSPEDEEPETYRFSDSFIKKATVALVIAIPALIVLGFAVMAMGIFVFHWHNDLAVNVGVWIAVSGVFVPFLIAAVLGGEAIKRGGGVIGFFLGVGFAALTLAWSNDEAELIPAEWVPYAYWGGGVSIALSTIGFWVIGWIAKVPMWLQDGPFAEPDRIHQRGSNDSFEGNDGPISSPQDDR